MVDSLYFAHSDVRDPREIAAAYRLRGWDVAVHDPASSESLELLASMDPLAVVFCLDSSCGSDVMSFAETVMADERTNRPLMVFVDCAAEEIVQAKGFAPYGIFVRPDELAWVLKRLIVRT